jgi:hypothetical protein
MNPDVLTVLSSARFRSDAAEFIATLRPVPLQLLNPISIGQQPDQSRSGGALCL